MKANELRIGNYVNADGNRKKVYNLYSNGWDFLHDDIDCRFVEYQNTKPIPLTEEILLKCGFIKNSSDKDNAWLNLRYRFLNFSSDESVCFNKVYLHINKMDIICEYLHQLQNLYFALTNEELIIKL